MDLVPLACEDEFETNSSMFVTSKYNTDITTNGTGTGTALGIHIVCLALFWFIVCVKSLRKYVFPMLRILWHLIFPLLIGDFF